MTHAQKPDFVFRRNVRVHLNQRRESVQSTAGSRGVSISGSNAGCAMFRGSVNSICYPLHWPVSPSFPLPYVTVCHHISTGVYRCPHTVQRHLWPRIKVTRPVRLCHIVTEVRCGVGMSLILHFIWGWHKSWFVSQCSIRNPHETLINFSKRFTKYKHSPAFCRITNTRARERASIHTHSCICSGVPRNLVRWGCFNKFSWGQKTENGDLWAIDPLSLCEGFWIQLYFGTRNFISYTNSFIIFGALRMRWMIASISWLQSALNFFRNRILI